ncbi:MAG TPA: hypothetical protein VNE63_19530 [Candidatus Acidoferrales bacterium]|nr:hypothetical protein [Candidatus Acidoferrales bacterium]
MARRTSFVCLLITVLLLPALACAEHTREWRQTNFSEFEKGTANGVAVRSDGKFMPAPKFDAFAAPNLAYIWQLRVDSRGRLFAAGGSDAKVLRFDDAGKATTVFESSELTAQAIVLDSKDNLYVATSPDGKVYKVTPDGQKSVFFDPKTKYIWALALDSQEDLFVATGDKGQVFVVRPDGKGQLFYQSDERHARSLAFDTKGDLLVGTEPDGLILRINILRKAAETVPTAGVPFVIYETNKSEVTSLLQDSNGNLYAASVGDKPRSPGFPRVVPGGVPPQAGSIVVTAQGSVVAQGRQQTTATSQATPYPFPNAPTGGAEVVQIAPDGSPRTLWTSRDDLVFAMALASSGHLLLGTGDKGTIIELEGNDIYSSVAQTASAQVTSLVASPSGEVFVATANAGKIFTLGPGYASQGSIESDAFDAKIFSHWGRLTWWGENGVMQGKVAFYVRSGNTSSPENNWSAWAGPYKTSGSGEVRCPPARFVQWKAVFLEPDGAGTPTISWVSLAYQPKNVAPVINGIAIQDPGVRVVGFPAQPNGVGGAAVPSQLRMPNPAGTNPSPPPEVTIRTNAEVPPQGFQEKGYESVLWNSADDNDDDLIYTIYYRAEGERTWHLLKDKLTQRFYSWDTTSMPDGAYYLKIVASDSPSNPSEQALSAERESDRFEIVNTPPQVENLQAVATASAVSISFDGVSSSDAIALARYSLDAGDWQIALPVGGLSDSPKESYQIQLHAVPSGEHTIAVQVTDRFDNATAEKTTFTVPARAAK